MSFELFPGVGLVHLNEARKPRVVPGPERHKWDIKPLRGQTATCLKCGAKKIHQLNYFTFYTAPGSPLKVAERPACHV